MVWSKYQTFISLLNTQIIPGCAQAREHLIVAVTSPTLSERIRSQFIPVQIPYKFLSDDSGQVIMLKKSINLLYNFEKTLLGITQIAPNTVLEGIALPKTIATAFYRLHQQMNEIIDVMTMSSSAIQAILGSQLNQMFPLLNTMTQQLRDLGGQLDKPGSVLGAAVGSSIRLLDISKKARVDIVHDTVSIISNLFKKAEQALGTDGMDVKWPDKKLDNEGSLDPIDTTIGQLLNELIELSHSAVTLTAASYDHLAQKLQFFQSETFPNVISQLASLEESMGLRAGILVEPVMMEAQNYYQKITNKMNEFSQNVLEWTQLEKHQKKWYATPILKTFRIQEKSHVLSSLKRKTQSDSLMDAGFIDKIRASQHKKMRDVKERLHALEYQHQAAHQFFEMINSKSIVAHGPTLHDKHVLAYLYQQFQPSLAAIDPSLDTKMVAFLNLSPQEGASLQHQAPESLSAYRTLWNGLSSAGQYLLWMAEEMTPPVQSILTVMGEREERLKETINREIATERERMDLISDTQMMMEKKYNERAVHHITLKPSVKAYVMKSYQFSEQAAPQTLYIKNLEMDHQLEDIIRAQTAYRQFIHQLNAMDRNHQRTLSQIPESQKAELRALYIQFQPFIHLMIDRQVLVEAFDDQCVEALTSTGSQETPLTIKKLIEMNDVMDRYFEAFKTQTQQDRAIYLEQELIARQMSASMVRLKPMRDNVVTETFFDRVKQVDYAGQMTHQLEQVILPFLKKNLSPTVLKELNLGVDHTERRYDKKRMEGSPQARLYQHFLNAFFHLEQALVSVNQSKTRVEMVKALLLVKQTILEVKETMKGLSDNPQFRIIFEQFQRTISPLVSMMKTHVTEVKDAFIDSMASNDNDSPSDHSSSIETALRQLHRKMDHRSEGRSSFSQATLSLIQSLDALYRHSSLNINPVNAMTLLKDIQRLQEVFSNTTLMSHDLMMTHLRELNTHFTLLILPAASALEMNLGLRPGVISAPLQEQFIQFYQEMLSRIPEIESGEALLLINDTSPLKALLHDEERQLKNMFEDPKSTLTEIEIKQEQIHHLSQQLVEREMEAMKHLAQFTLSQVIKPSIVTLLNKNYIHGVNNGFATLNRPDTLALLKRIIAQKIALEGSASKSSQAKKKYHAITEFEQTFVEHCLNHTASETHAYIVSFEAKLKTMSRFNPISHISDLKSRLKAFVSSKSISEERAKSTPESESSHIRK